MADFAPACALIISAEGAFSLDHDDPGNWTGGKVGAGELRGTKRGISAAAYPSLDIANLSDAQIDHIYEWDYFRSAGCDRLDWRWALPVFDCAVNEGVGIAKRFLQAALGMHLDGVIGPVTISAARNASDEAIDIFMALRAIRYAGDPKFPRDGKGWLKRTYQIRRLAALQPAP